MPVDTHLCRREGPQGEGSFTRTSAVPTGSSEAKVTFRDILGYVPKLPVISWGLNLGNREGSSFHSKAISREESVKSQEQPLPGVVGCVSQLRRGT